MFVFLAECHVSYACGFSFSHWHVSNTLLLLNPHISPLWRLMGPSLQRWFSVTLEPLPYLHPDGRVSSYHCLFVKIALWRVFVVCYLGKYNLPFVFVYNIVCQSGFYGVYFRRGWWSDPKLPYWRSSPTVQGISCLVRRFDGILIQGLWLFS